VAGVIKCGAAQPESTRGLWVLGYGFDRWCLGMGTAILKKYMLSISGERASSSFF
jgi:hypothetical protein